MVHVGDPLQILGIMHQILTKFGLPQGGTIRCDEGGEISHSTKFRKKVEEFGYFVN